MSSNHGYLDVGGRRGGIETRTVGDNMRRIMKIKEIYIVTNISLYFFSD